jgi:ABC-2 type transport system ATP-binding protein
VSALPPPPAPAPPPPPPPPPVPADARIVVDHVSKWFGDLVAVSDVTFHIGPGVTALLGPNGAGKSTMMRLLCGLTPPSQGSVRVLGGDPRRDISLTRRIGLVPQQETLFEGQSALQFVRLAAVLHRLDDPDGAARAALGVVELDPDEPRPIAGFSKGMRQRAKVAQAIVGDPDVVVLDEPLTGLDPRQRLHLISLFGRLGASGKTVLVSSHVLEEVERFGSRVLVMAQGRLAAEGDFHAIRDLMDDRPHRIRLRTDRPRVLATGLLERGSVVAVALQGDDTVVVDTTDAARLRRDVPAVAAEGSARLLEVTPLDDDLESVFRYLVGT